MVVATVVSVGVVVVVVLVVLEVIMVLVSVVDPKSNSKFTNGLLLFVLSRSNLQVSGKGGSRRWDKIIESC